MGLDISLIEGQTPLDDEEREGLLIPGITTRKELDEFEQSNIENAIRWTLGKKLSADKILSEQFIKLLHAKMFGDVWKWAGQFRRSNKNLGVVWTQVPMDLRNLIDDCRVWIENDTYFGDEIAVRFKHKIVQIHCFANGNGRHSRLLADLITTKIFGLKPFSWGGGNLNSQGNVRSQYLKAVKEADKGDIESLVGFARA